MAATKTEPLYDVVIYDIATQTVASIIGTAMRRDTGHSNAEKRLATAFMRTNEAYSAAIVRTGRCKVGAVLKTRDIVQ